MHHADLDKWIIKMGEYLQKYEPEEFERARDFYRTLPNGQMLSLEQLNKGNSADFWQWYISIWRRDDGKSWGEFFLNVFDLTQEEQENFSNLHRSRYSIFRVCLVNFLNKGWLRLEDIYDLSFEVDVHDESSSALLKKGALIDAMMVYWNGMFNLFGVSHLIGLPSADALEFARDPRTGSIIPCLRHIWKQK